MNAKLILACSLLLTATLGCGSDDSSSPAGSSGGAAGAGTGGSGTGGSGTGGSGTGGSGTGGSGTGGSGTGGTAGVGTGGAGGTGPGVPIVTTLSCASLPAALDGGSPTDGQLFIHLLLDLSCKNAQATDPLDFDGASLRFDWYKGATETAQVGVKGVYQTAQNYLAFKSISDASTTPLKDINGKTYGASGLKWGQDYTITLTDYPAGTRTIEVLFQIQPPYLILRSVTEK